MTQIAGYFQDLDTGLIYPLQDSPSLTYSCDLEHILRFWGNAQDPDDNGPKPIQVQAFDLGGGTLNLKVDGVLWRYNAGDAEAFAYDFLTKLCDSGVGNLG